MNTDVTTLLRQRGISIAPEWSNEIGLTREDAISVLRVLREEGRAVLGGDVYHQTAGEIKSAYANWHCDRTAGESDDEYVNRSVKAGIEYVSRYPEAGSGQTPLFVLVLASSS